MGFQAISQKIDVATVLKRYALSGEALQRKQQRDNELTNILSGKDSRFLVIIGPCSAHDEEAVMEYARRLQEVQERLKDKLLIIPRVYTNKPRTNGDGYKGLLHQPNATGNVNLIKGIDAVRRIHYRVITETGLTTADEMLYPENLELVKDLLSYVAIGARSVEDQNHRFVASGIDQPVGMKNPTSGHLNVMFHSIYAAQQSHEFIYNNQEVKTTSNPYAHAILRGGLDNYGKNIPNYHYENLLDVKNEYDKLELINPFVIIDTNHDNSGKQFKEQVRIIQEVLNNRQWNTDLQPLVRGFMIESFLEEGRQEMTGQVFGQSITDPCLGWKETEELLTYIASFS
ncbi:3-deoxy-7-phosphoheptulonate synthase [Vagococcus penaei]|uniref:Phospho-2-dehydro-3-deoxyheptonate aldolase n=1 Tax=Vagococcus penaei TaxID=633807 RepID=A0A1Q2D992_9ENTE|nr:3-deoxy-7-phosphoheptulonate synthase [Vagococcus penaei]AQP54733.1 3-deoxy-7-phosphoheptulonate synthase [Vagococcus penaei]RSU05389.1 3-deoxy-7-phosphoheptulonate synthase [Vagococcus penaei]